MAVTKKKSARKVTTTKNFMNDDAAEEEVLSAVEDEDEDVETVSLEGEDSKPAPSKPLNVVGAKSKKPNAHIYEMVTITVFETMDPAPSIGLYNFMREKGTTVLTKGKHELPRFVAEVLVEKGKATM